MTDDGAIHARANRGDDFDEITRGLPTVPPGSNVAQEVKRRPMEIPEDLRNRHEEMVMQATSNFPPEMIERIAALQRSRDELLEALREMLSSAGHIWTGCRLGGHPANADSYEWVRYCQVCGMEDTCEDPLPPCPRGDDYPYCGPVWPADAEFTRDRLEEIRQLREEIECVSCDFDTHQGNISEAMSGDRECHPDLIVGAVMDLCRYARVRARLKRKLAALTQGMKEAND